MSSELRQQIIARALALREPLSDGTAKIDALIRDHEVVFAAWPDAGQPNNIGFIVVKGAETLGEIAASQHRDLAWTAVPCSSAAEAQAILEMAVTPGSSQSE